MEEAAKEQTQLRLIAPGEAEKADEEGMSPEMRRLILRFTERNTGKPFDRRALARRSLTAL
jgi:hypothetical protein